MMLCWKWDVSLVILDMLLHSGCLIVHEGIKQDNECLHELSIDSRMRIVSGLIGPTGVGVLKLSQPEFPEKGL